LHALLIKSAAPAEALVRKIEQAGGRALAAKSDVSAISRAC
jgi:hypothetical protein